MNYMITQRQKWQSSCMLIQLLKWVWHWGPHSILFECPSFPPGCPYRGIVEFLFAADKRECIPYGPAKDCLCRRNISQGQVCCMFGAEHVGDHHYLEMLLRVPNRFHFWAWWEYILLLSGCPASSRYLSCHCHQVNAGQWRMDWRCWVCKPPTATSLILCVNEGCISELPLLPGQCWTRMDWQATATVFFQYLN